MTEKSPKILDMKKYKHFWNPIIQLIGEEPAQRSMRDLA